MIFKKKRELKGNLIISLDSVVVQHTRLSLRFFRKKAPNKRAC